ncbi:MAG: hypothetical protein ABSB69_07605 [Solirubrobacteraceae bacterium]|jgi:hypothetical protein
MNKLLQAALLGIVGLVVLTAAAPTITQIIKAIVPLVVAIGIVAAVLRLVWFYTR